MIIELSGDNYKVEYNNWSFLVLERDYGFDITNKEIFQQKEGDISFAFAFKFLLLGLIENHHQEEDLQQLLKDVPMTEILNEDVMQKCYKAFARSMPEVGNDAKKEQTAEEE